MALEEGEACSLEAGAQTCMPAFAGRPLRGRIKAGKGGATLRLDGARLQLGPGATLTVGASSQMSVAGQRRPLSVVTLQEGSVLVSPGSSPQFVQVRGNGSSLAMTDGWALFHRAGRQLSAANLAGHVWLGHGAVQTGQTRLISPEGLVSSRPALKNTPQLEPSKQVALDLFQHGEPLDLRWQPVAGATAYLVRLHRESGELVRGWLTDATSSLVLRGVGAGEYKATVTPLDAAGSPGQESAPRGMSVVRVKLPTGSLQIPDHEIQMPEGRAIELEHTARIEMADQGSSLFFPAPRELQFKGWTRSLWLRHKEGGEAALLTIAERAVKAEVTMGPKTARWPADPIQISIALRGLPARTSMAISPRVSLGLNAVDARWSREGSQWRTTIAPVPISTYQVLRVEVFDEFGVLLGRDFLEIQPTP